MKKIDGGKAESELRDPRAGHRAQRRSTLEVLASLKALRDEIKAKASAEEILAWVHEGR
jgi:uncharacterized coiled-coil DUF342 family protein